MRPGSRLESQGSRVTQSRDPVVRANKETMSRAEKLYDRLDAMESEYSQMIAGELRRWITDGFSIMLHRAIFSRIQAAQVTQPTANQLAGKGNHRHFLNKCAHHFFVCGLTVLFNGSAQRLASETAKHNDEKR